jgi:hypothetical protein
MKRLLFFVITFLICLLQTGCDNIENETSQAEYYESDIVGSWKLKEMKVKLKEQFLDTAIWSFPSDYAEQISTDHGFLGSKLDDNFIMTFENDSMLRVNDKTTYFYSINDQRILLLRGDLAGNLKYKLKNEELVIYDGTSVLERSIVLEKK